VCGVCVCVCVCMCVCMCVCRWVCVQYLEYLFKINKIVYVLIHTHYSSLQQRPYLPEGSDQFLGVNSDFKNVVDQRKQWCQWECSDKEGDKSKLEAGKKKKKKKKMYAEIKTKEKYVCPHRNIELIYVPHLHHHFKVVIKGAEFRIVTQIQVLFCVRRKKG